MKKLFLLTLILTSFQSANAQSLIDTARDFSHYSTHGELLELYPVLTQEKVVVLDFFTTSCGPCTTYAPDIQQIHEAYGSNQGDVIVWGLDWGNDNWGVRNFDSINGITYPTVSGMEGGANVTNLVYQIQSRPTVLIILPNTLIHSQFHVWGTPPSFHNIDSVLTQVLSLVTSAKSLERKERPDLQISPNPAREHIVISSLNESRKGIAEIFDLTGRKWLTTPLSTDNKIPLQGIPSGVYLLRVEFPDGTSRSSKFLVY